MGDDQNQFMTSLDQILDEINDRISDNRRTKAKPVKIEKKYEYQKSMLYAIQALTGQPTHEIIAFLVEEADKHLNASGIDLNKRPEKNMLKDNYGYSCNERRCHKYMFYPGTELHIGIYTTYHTYGARASNVDAIVKYNFKLPSASIKMDQKEYDDYISDGILCDSSKDVGKPEMKGTLTEEEREIREAQRKETARIKALSKKKKQKKTP